MLNKKQLNKSIVKIKYFALILAVFCLVFGNYSFAQDQDNIEFLNIQVEHIDGKTVKIKWSTSPASKGKVLYGKAENSLDSYLIDNKGLLKYHEILIGNLETETTYYFQIAASNNNEEVYSFIQSFKTIEYNDGIAPGISDLSIPYISGTAAFIKWTTDEKAKSVVEYDQYKTYKKRVSDRNKSTSHQIILKKLTPDIKYYLRIYSIDEDNNKSGYSYREVTTQPTSKMDNEDLIISYLRPSSASDSNISDKSVTVSFKTNHYAKGYIKLSRRGSRTKTHNLDYGLNHSAVFSDLYPETEYKVNISMTDIFRKNAKTNFSVKTVEFIVNVPAAAVNGAMRPDGGAANGGVIVRGAENSYYVPASALYKYYGSPNVYAIANGQRHYISSPASFREYGYSWADVKTISWQKLSEYPRARLLKSLESSVIYYIYQRKESQWLKIAIPSPTAFISYQDNYWGNIITVTQTDIGHYPDVKLIKAPDSAAVYYLEDNIKYYASAEVFNSRGFSDAEIVEVSQIHLDTYKTGSPLN